MRHAHVGSVWDLACSSGVYTIPRVASYGPGVYILGVASYGPVDLLTSLDQSLDGGYISVKVAGVGVGTVGERCRDCSEQDTGCSAKPRAR